MALVLCRKPRKTLNPLHFPRIRCPTYTNNLPHSCSLLIDWARSWRFMRRLYKYLISYELLSGRNAQRVYSELEWE